METKVLSKPLAIDLFAGLGGWTDGLLAAGYFVVGFDNERHVYGEHRYPAQLVLQDVLTLHGRQFKDAALIVASPPCQEFSYMAMPWSLAKEKQARIKADPAEQKHLTALFDACFRIQREACEAAGHHIPLVVENVRGAQKWVGRARWNFGSFYLWGDVPALMPIVSKRPAFKGGDRNLARASGGHQWNTGFDVGVKQSIGSWSDFGKPDYVPFGFNREAEKAIKNSGGSWFNVGDGHTTSGKGQNPDGRKVPGARKAASAMIAKIPFELARHIAASWYPA